MLAFDMLYDALMRFALRTVEMNLVPDFLLRRGIRFLLAQRLRELKAPNGEEQQRRLVVRAPARALAFPVPAVSTLWIGVASAAVAVTCWLRLSAARAPAAAAVRALL
jgi:hypothetical protein